MYQTCTLPGCPVPSCRALLCATRAEGPMPAQQTVSLTPERTRCCVYEGPLKLSCGRPTRSGCLWSCGRSALH